MKLACVIHRYGAGIAGGSEGHCRAIAERLAVRHDVTVLTSCAADHMTWRNELPEGTSHEGGVRVVRFPTARQRSLGRFAEISAILFGGDASAAEQEDWFRANGPETPGLLEHLSSQGRDYDLVLFWAFRYAPTFFGVPIVADRAVLVPTAEDDPLIRSSALEPFFARPAGLVFLTPEEQALVELHARVSRPSCTIGSGLDPVPLTRDAAADAGVLAGINVIRPFVLYLGRIDPNKGCETLLREYLDARVRERAGGWPPLVMAGPANMPIPSHPSIVTPGRVSDRQREALLAQASVLVVPSPFESLSLVLLEAWNHATPALVNGQCRVLEGQARRANGALVYRGGELFTRALAYLLDHPDTAAQLGRQGRAYVDREYRWPTVMDRLGAFLEDVAASRTARVG